MYEKDLINVTIEDKTYKVEKNITFLELVKKLGKNQDEIFGVIVDNEYHTVDYTLIEDCKCKFITYGTDEGDRIYYRTLKFIFIMAFRRLFPEVNITIANKISREILFLVENLTINEDVVAKIKRCMNDIIKKDLRIYKRQVSFRKMRKLYKDNGCLEQLENFKLNLRDIYTYNQCEEEINYLYGNLLYSTSQIKGYDVRIYKNSLILVLPDKNDVNIVSKSVKSKKVLDIFEKLYSFSNNLGINNINTLNEYVLRRQAEDIIRKCEVDHQIRLFDLSKKIQTNDKIKLIFIAGPSSSGKTTFAQKFQVMLSLFGKKSKVISMDNYFHDLENIPMGKDGKLDYETINNVDIKLFKSQMNELLHGNKVILPKYNFNTSKKEFFNKPYYLDDNTVLIIEGIHALNPILTKKIAKEAIFKVYVAPLVNLNFDNFTKVSSSDLRLLRRIIRDYETRGLSVEKTLQMWKQVKSGEDKYIYPYIKEADFLYNTSLIYEFGVLRPFVEELLLEVDENSKYYAETRRLYKFIQNFRTIETSYTPSDSIIKEFIGRGCFYR